MCRRLAGVHLAVSNNNNWALADSMAFNLPGNSLISRNILSSVVGDASRLITVNSKARSSFNRGGRGRGGFGRGRGVRGGRGGRGGGKSVSGGAATSEAAPTSGAGGL